MTDITKSMYLKQLKKEMLRFTSRKEAVAVVKDYDEYFESGKLDGKTEAELCAQFGEPKALAAELLANTKRPYGVKNAFKNLFYEIYNRNVFYFILLFLVIKIGLESPNRSSIPWIVEPVNKLLKLSLFFSLNEILIALVAPLILFKWIKIKDRLFTPLKTKSLDLVLKLCFAPLILGVIAWFSGKGWIILEIWLCVWEYCAQFQF